MPRRVSLTKKKSEDKTFAHTILALYDGGGAIPEMLEKVEGYLVPDALKKLIYDITFAVLEDFSGSYQI